MLKHQSPRSSIDEITAAVRSDRAVVVDAVLDNETVERLLAELRPHMDRTRLGNDEITGTRTTRTGGVVARSEAARAVVQHPLALDVARKLLSPWSDKIQLQLTQLIRLLPGQGQQPLHRDALIWGKYLGSQLGKIEPQFNCMWALTDFTTENGATRIALGSHCWPHQREAEDHEIVQATMAAGSVLFFTGSVLHGGGANQSSGERIGLNVDYCLSWLRQEENQYLSCPPEVARDLEPELQELLGYTTCEFGLGYYTSLDDPGISAPERALGREPRKELRFGPP